MLPDWFRPYAGPPSRKPSADGSIFIAQLGSRDGDKASFRVYVFHVAKDSTNEIPIDSPPKNHSALDINIDGTLVLCGEKDGKIREWVIPGYVAPQQAISAIEDATPLHNEDYESLDELFSAPGFLLRFNKQLRAILQLRDIARKRGELR